MGRLAKKKKSISVESHLSIGFELAYREPTPEAAPGATLSTALKRLVSTVLRSRVERMLPMMGRPLNKERTLVTDC